MKPNAKLKYEYDWSPEFGWATCTIYDHDTKFYGAAKCHPDDEDMKNRLAGQNIAEARASIQYLKHIRDNELRPQLKISMEFQMDVLKMRKLKS